MRDDPDVRTTLDLDDDVLLAAKELAMSRRSTAGKIVSELVRQALAPKRGSGRTRNGVPLLPPRPPGSALTMAVVNNLRDD